MSTDLNQRVLVLMPSSRDAASTASMLRKEGVASVVCVDLAGLCKEIGAGTGAILITDDAIFSDSAGQLAGTLRAQPGWSAVPIVVIAREAAARHVQQVASPEMDGIIVIERPVRMESLLSVLRSALRTRQHQYQIRDDIAVRERQAETLRLQDERLRFAMRAGGLGSWSLDLETMAFEASPLCKQTFGRAPGDPFTYALLRASIHPDDRARVEAALQASVETGVDYDVEHRAVWPNGEEHWVMMRGRGSHALAGGARYIAGVSQDVHERRSMHDALLRSKAELAQQAEQLQDINRRKDEFVATLAHELRNPLAPIRTGIHVLRSDPPPATAERLLAVMDRQVTHMVRLIDDLLDVSRITRGTLELRKEPTTLGSVVEAAVEASRSHLALRGHELMVDMPNPGLALDVDAARIAQALGNLLLNASKYTPSGGHVRLSATHRGGVVAIEVRDDGIGIPKERLADVFEMFSQVVPELEGRQGGLGIGLALVRTVIEMHGGVVRATSAGPGRGSSFAIELPLPAASAAAPMPSERTTLPPPASSRRILVVDDNDDAAELLAVMLQTEGYETTIASDGASAIAAALASTPDYVILDIGLPDVTGYDVARALRKIARVPPLGIIALTGWGTEVDKQKARDAGFDVHLTKPVDTDRLHEALAEVEQIVTSAR